MAVAEARAAIEGTEDLQVTKLEAFTDAAGGMNIGFDCLGLTWTHVVVRGAPGQPFQRNDVVQHFAACVTCEEHDFTLEVFEAFMASLGQPEKGFASSTEARAYVFSKS